MATGRSARSRPRRSPRSPPAAKCAPGEKASGSRRRPYCAGRWRRARTAGKATARRGAPGREPAGLAACSEIDLQAVVRGGYLERLLAARELLEAARLLEQALERRIVVGGLLVEEHEVLRPR